MPAVQGWATSSDVLIYIKDPCLWGPMDPDLDPAIFVLDLQDVHKKQFFIIFSAYYFLKVHL
jgi:hypothetical protein